MSFHQSNSQPSQQQIQFRPTLSKSVAGSVRMKQQQQQQQQSHVKQEKHEAQQQQRQQHHRMVESHGVANSNKKLTIKRGRPPKMCKPQRNSNAVQLTMKQSRKLVYVTIKNMLKNFGDVLPKGGKMTFGAWEEIAAELNAMPGMQRPAKLWARCFVSKKHFVSSKFKAFIKKQTGVCGKDFQPDWTNFSHFDLLLLQEYRLQYNFTDMPDVHKLLKSIDKHKLLDVDWQVRFPKESDITAHRRSSQYTPSQNTSAEHSSGNGDDHSLHSPQESRQSFTLSSFNQEPSIENTQQIATVKSPPKKPTWVRTGQMPYLTYLAYLAGQQLMKRYGLPLTKHSGLPLKMWKSIADKMYAKMGIHKLPQQWRKTYSANKYVMQTRFLKRLQEEERENPNYTIDWSKIRIEELLNLQTLRSDGYPDMPDFDDVLRAYERNQQFLDSGLSNLPGEMRSSPAKDSNGSPQRSSRSSSIAPTVYNIDTDVEIKSEPFSEEMNQEQHEIHVKKELETEGEGDDGAAWMEDEDQDKNNENELEASPESMPIILADPHLTSTVNASPQENSTTKHIKTKTNSKEVTPSPETATTSKAEPFDAAREQFKYDQRMLEINERILGAKLKKNKLLRKRNKVLKEHSRVFGELLTKLDALIEQKK